MADRPLARRNTRATARLRGASVTDRSHTPGIQLATCARPLLWHCRDAACRVLTDDYIGRKNRPNPAVAAPPGRGPALLACAFVRARRRAPESANAFVDRVRAEAEAELQRLLAERGLPCEWNVAPARRLNPELRMSRLELLFARRELAAPTLSPRNTRS